MPRIYLINRYDETLSLSDYLAELLRARYGARNVLRGTIARSANEYSQAVERDLRSCDMAMVVMGPRWLTNPGDTGQPWLARLDDPTRIALATTLRLNILLAPVLSEGAKMPTAADLPPDLSRLPQIQAFPVRPQPYFQSDMNLLYQQIDTKLRWRPASVPIIVVTLLGMLALLALLIVGTGAPEASLATAYAAGFAVLATVALLAATISAVTLAIRRKSGLWIWLLAWAFIFTLLSLPLPVIAASLAALGSVLALVALIRAAFVSIRSKSGRWPWLRTAIFVYLTAAIPLALLDQPLQTAFWMLPVTLLAFALLGPRRETAYG